MIFKRIKTSEDAKGTWGIYIDSFPEYERRKKGSHLNALSNPTFKATEIIDNETIVGLLFYWDFENYIFVEHLAIDSSMRSKSYGSAILTKLIAENSNKLIILEIEPPVDEITRRRHTFYERLGFVMNNFYYEHPSFDIVNPKVHELKLMTFPRAITQSELNEFLSNMKNVVLKYVE